MKSNDSNLGSELYAQYAHSGNAAEQILLEKRSAETEAAFLLPHLKSGFNILDCGCGPGTITIGLARAVSPGRVTGIDIEKTQIERARELAHQSGLTNIDFKVGSIDQLPFPNDSFDVVYANAVLEHLRDPLQALEEFRRVLKIGGIVALRDADLEFLAIGGPHEALLRRSCTIMAEQWQHVSGNPYIGRNLRSLLNQAGYVNSEGMSTTEYFGASEATRWFGEFMAGYFEDCHVNERLSLLKLATMKELDAIKAAWRDWRESPDAFATVLWCEALGRKKSC